MAPSYQRLISQTSSLSRSPTGNDGSRAENPPSNTNSIIVASQRIDRCSGPGTFENVLADSASAVASAQSHQNSSSIGTGRCYTSHGSAAAPSSKEDASQPLVSAESISSAAASAVSQAQHLYPRAPTTESASSQLAPQPQRLSPPAEQPRRQPQTLASHQQHEAARGQPSHRTAGVAPLQHHMSHMLAPTLRPSARSNIFKGMELRRGKWTPEEERYASRLIEDFEKGTIADCENGTTLRAFLSRKLHCAPMRISKKFAGKSIGKHVFLSRTPNKFMIHGSSQHRDAETLRYLEACFYRSLSTDGNINSDSTNIKVTMIAASGYFPPPQFSHHSHSIPLPTRPVLFHSPEPSARTASSSAQPDHVMAPQGSWHRRGVETITTGNLSRAENVTNTDHSQHLREAYLDAIERTPDKSSNSGHSQSSEQGDNDGGFIQSHIKPSRVPAGVAKATGGTVGKTNGKSQDSSVGTTQTPQCVGPSTIPAFLTGFEKVASTLLPSVDSMNAGRSPQTPTFTSKSFDELHKFLWTDNTHFQLDPTTTSSDQVKGLEGPASDALRQQQAEKISVGKGNSTAEMEQQGLPKPALASSHFPNLTGTDASGLSAHHGPVTADAYAMFAQQSVLAVSQHSAYCRSEPQSNFVLKPFGPGLQCPSGDTRGAAVIEDEGSTASESKFNAANLKAHAKAVEAKNGPSLSGSNETLLRQHHKRVRTVATSSEGFMTSTGHANMISSSERSSSDMGTETESAIGSSQASSAGSGSENASDNGSDNASVQSESDGSGKTKAQISTSPIRAKDGLSFCVKRKRNQQESLPSSALGSQ